MDELLRGLERAALQGDAVAEARLLREMDSNPDVEAVKLSPRGPIFEGLARGLLPL